MKKKGHSLYISPKFLSLIHVRLLYRRKLLSDDITTAILNTLIKSLKKKSVKEVRAVIEDLKPRKTLGYDLITNQIIQKLLDIRIKFIIQLCNTILRWGFFSTQWKLAQIIMIQRTDKSAEFAESYSPIKLLSVLSKLFEKLLFSSFFIIIERHKLIPDH